MSPERKHALKTAAAIVVFYLIAGGQLVWFIWLITEEKSPCLVIPVALFMAALILFITYIIFIRPIRDYYLERKYGWVKCRDPRFREWLAEQVDVLSEMGFFKEFEDLTEKLRLSRIASRLNKRCDLITVVRHPCLVAGADSERIWWDDTEDERWTDGDGYVEFLSELARISGGAFQPQDVTSEPAEDGNAAIIRFQHQGTTHEVSVNTEDDWMDGGLIVAVNQSIADSGVEFVEPRYGQGQEKFLVCLSKDHQQRLRTRLKWRF